MRKLNSAIRRGRLVGRCELNLTTLHLLLPAVLGTTEVPAGKYQLKFDGSKVTLVNASNGKRLERDATVQEMPTKFSADDRSVQTH